MDNKFSNGGWTDDNFSSLIAERRKDESLEELEDSPMGDECVSKSLLLTSKLAEEIYLAVNASRPSEFIPEFELQANGIRIVSVRMSRGKLQKNHVKAKADNQSWRNVE